MLAKLEKYSSFVMLGFMVRDAISDYAHGDMKALAKDLSFLSAAMFSSPLSRLFMTYGDKLIERGFKFSGYGLKGIGHGIGRAISLYILYDFFSNVVQYSKDTNNTEAKIGMEIDGAFLFIDGITLGVEVFESMGYIAGWSSVAGPIGAALGATIILGANVYTSVQKVRKIEEILHLNLEESIDESIRAFFHMDSSPHVKELISETQANNVLMSQAERALFSQANIDTYIIEAGYVKDKSIIRRVDNIIDVRHTYYDKISTALPEPQNGMKIICYLHEELRETAQSENGIIEKASNFFSDLIDGLDVLGSALSGDALGVMKAVVHDDADGSTYKHSSKCVNSFGIQKADSDGTKAAYFDLGDGRDIVFGYSNKSNIFRLGNGVKNIYGGNESNTFIMTAVNFSGILKGGKSNDKLDFSQIGDYFYTVYENNTFRLFNREVYSIMHVKDIEILVGARNRFEYIICDCFLSKVETYGGRYADDRRVVGDYIYIPNSDCEYNLTLGIEGNTSVTNDASIGVFIYHVFPLGSPNNELDVRLKLFQPANHTIFFNESLINVYNIGIENIGENVQLGIGFFNESYVVTMEVTNKSQETVKIHFQDGSLMTLHSDIPSIMCTSDLRVDDMISVYSSIADKFGINLIAYSIVDKESVTFTHGQVKVKDENNKTEVLHIVHSPTDHKNSLMLNGGRYLVLINAKNVSGCTTIAVENFNLVFTLQSKVTIDFSPFIKQVEEWEKSLKNVRIVACSAENDDLIILYILVEDVNASSASVAGSISLKNIFVNNYYTNVKINNYGQLLIYKNYSFEKLPYTVYLNGLNLSGVYSHLLPTPIEYNKDQNFILLTQYDLEWNHTIEVNFSIGNYNYYKMNSTHLVFTNAEYNLLWDYQNMCTIFILNFFNVAKLKTLNIESRYKDINLWHDIDKVESAPDISSMWKHITSLNDQFNGNLI